jgi:hypothetical protein
MCNGQLKVANFVRRTLDRDSWGWRLGQGGDEKMGLMARMSFYVNVLMSVVANVELRMSF